MAGRYLQRVSHALLSLVVLHAVNVYSGRERQQILRFHRLSKLVQEVFNLARLLSELVKWTRVVGGVVAS